MKKLDANCILYKSSREAASEELLSVVVLHEVDGPLNTYWFGIAEVATDQETFQKWIEGNPDEIFLLIRLSDGRRGHGHHLASKLERDSESDVVHISFFGLTQLC